MATRQVNPIHKITAFMGWVVLLAVLGLGAYTGYGYYQAYDNGYAAGKKAGRAFQRVARDENLKFNAYYRALHQVENSRMPRRNGTSWKDALYRQAWDSGLTAIAGHAPTY